MISEILVTLSLSTQGFAVWKAAAEESQGAQSVPKLIPELLVVIPLFVAMAVVGIL